MAKIQILIGLLALGISPLTSSAQQLAQEQQHQNHLQSHSFISQTPNFSQLLLVNPIPNTQSSASPSESSPPSSSLTPPNANKIPPLADITTSQIQNRIESTLNSQVKTSYFQLRAMLRSFVPVKSDKNISVITMADRGIWATLNQFDTSLLSDFSTQMKKIITDEMDLLYSITPLAITEDDKRRMVLSRTNEVVRRLVKLWNDRADYLIQKAFQQEFRLAVEHRIGLDHSIYSLPTTSNSVFAPNMVTATAATTPASKIISASNPRLSRRGLIPGRDENPMVKRISAIPNRLAWRPSILSEQEKRIAAVAVIVVDIVRATLLHPVEAIFTTVGFWSITGAMEQIAGVSPSLRSHS